jgi:hypothetical protein
MTEDTIAQIRTHRDNIQRYRRLLSTKLTDQERNFIERRIAEEQDASAKCESKLWSTQEMF